MQILGMSNADISMSIFVVILLLHGGNMTFQILLCCFPIKRLRKQFTVIYSNSTKF